MATSACSAEKRASTTPVSLYCGFFGPFAKTGGRPLANAQFNYILGLLSPHDLTEAEVVCHSWKHFISTTGQWKKQCQHRLNIPNSMDPMSFLPQECNSYKKGTLSASTKVKVLDARIYQYILGAEIEPIPTSLKDTSLEKRDEPDPCDRTQTIGQNYVWMDSPSYFNLRVDENFPFELNKPDDPNDVEAPRLIEKNVSLIERSKRKIGPGSIPEKKIIKVPNTLNNLGVLFKDPKNGNHSTYGYIWEAILVQHGNKRIPNGRICMREDVIGKGLIFAQQQTMASEAEVIIAQLGHRILFNFLRRAETNTYSDGQNPWTFARTSTLTVDLQRIAWPTGCGGGGRAGLSVCNVFDNGGLVGAAVTLPIRKFRPLVLNHWELD